ncbi:unnamed protein product [Bursaphelenchus xylophilus]|uniref:(pine wood nematode) hypothetical protein n=1 Tax=Bursaphelenchus xylophilus TaxID=6326 RepID=A0A7I8X1E0_BURXY|nr:unnamed protein product [Bursaphelenchus xylophilus]CAG9130415.1 unnamed protein product [Bursaphelenchus xylophilus]
MIRLSYVLILIGFVAAETINQRCDTDADCPEPLVCRLLCKNTCNTMCIDLTFTRRKQPLKFGRRPSTGRIGEPSLFRDPPAFEPNPPAPEPTSVSVNALPLRNEPVSLRPPIGPPIWTPNPRISEHFSVKNCPPPEICKPNCGIYIDEFGCQGCQCLWISQACHNDYECANEGQYCDLGRCECGRGYRQHPRHSGVCQRVGEGIYQDEIPSEDKYLKSLPLIRRKKSIPKRKREERLQWPGPCDNDSQCPSNLYCINFDCWHIPERPLRAFQNDVELKKTAEVSTTNDDDKILASQVVIPEETTKTREILIETSLDENIKTPDIEIRPPSIRPEDILPEFTTIKSVRPVLFTSSPIDQEVEDEKETANTKKGDKYIAKATRSYLRNKDAKNAKIEESTPHPSNNDDDVVDTQVAENKNASEVNEEASTLPAILDVPEEISMTKIEDADPSRIFINYSKSNRHKKPVRIEMKNAKDLMRDECTTSSDCGQRYICCVKRWCDLSKECGIGRFCLPDCKLTKMMHPRGEKHQAQIDLVYD